MGIFKCALFITWVSYMITLSLLVFLRGFLLYRNVSEDRSICQNNIECSNNEDIRIILLIVDALRYDFVKWQDINTGNHSYTNKMVHLNELMEKYPLNSRLYKFIADPPTTTLQRIKGLTTGTFPTFIDVSSNFGTSEINEDNIIDQIISKNKTIVMLGDDTWSQLFHKRFTRESVYPSLNVWDLDTVDNGVILKLNEELNKTDWSLLIGHMLGVDHVGHTYGPSHPLMTEKLKQTDGFIRDIVRKINYKTVLFVFGDHGMTESGDHGGSSDLEITSALVVYSHNTSIINYFENRESVNQIDIVPTLSQLLNVPIPFSNLGRSLLTGKAQAREHFRDNARQVYSYIMKYSQQNALFRKEMDALTKEYKLLENNYSFRNSLYINSVISFIERVQSLCKSYWVQFDYHTMFYGIFLFFLSLLFIFIIITCFPISEMQNILNFKLFILIISLTIFALCLVKVLHFIEKVSNLETFFYIVSISISLFLVLLICIKHYKSLYKNVISCSVPYQNICAFIFCTLACLAILSNSFVVSEQYVISFLLLSVIWTSVLLRFRSEHRMKWMRFMCKKQGKRIAAALLFTFLLNLSTFYWECREEHGPDCIINKQNSIFSTVTSIVSLLSLVIGSRVYLKRYFRNDDLPALLKFVSITCVIAIISIWTIKIFKPNCLTHQPDCSMSYVPKLMLIFKILILGTIVFAWILSIFRSSLPLNWRIRKLQLYKELEDPGQSIVICRSTYIFADILNLIVFTILLLAIIVGESRAITLVLCIISLFMIAYIFGPLEDINDFNHWLFVVAWSLSSWHWFYSTGHQPTFPNIRWNVVELTNGYCGGLLILFETFSSLIIHALIMPAIVIFVNFHIQKKKTIITSHYSIAKKILSYIIVQSSRLFFCTVCAFIHARHLMVWKIFAPKFIFEGIGFLFSIPFTICGFLFLKKISQDIVVINPLYKKHY